MNVDIVIKYKDNEDHDKVLTNKFIYGTKVGSTAFKVFVNGTEITNNYYTSTDYISDVIFSKSNVIPEFYSTVKATADMKISFEGTPEKIKLSDIRLKDETEYSYIQIDDSIYEGLYYELKYESTGISDGSGSSARIEQICPDYFGNTLFYVEKGKNIIITARLEDTYYFKNSPVYFYLDGTQLNNTSSIDDEFKSEAVTAPAAQGGILRLTASDAPVEVPDNFKGLTLYATRVLKYDDYMKQQQCDIKNVKVAFGEGKKFTLTADNTILEGTYTPTNSGAKFYFENPNYYANLYGYDGRVSLQILDSSMYYDFYFQNLSKDGVAEASIGLYTDGEANIKAGESGTLNVKFVGLDEVPDSISLYADGTDDTNKLRDYKLTNKTTWDNAVTDAEITLETNDQMTGNHQLYVKAGEVISNALEVEVYTEE